MIGHLNKQIEITALYVYINVDCTGGPKKRGLSFLSPNNILKGAQVYSFQFLKRVV